MLAFFTCCVYFTIHYRDFKGMLHSSCNNIGFPIFCVWNNISDLMLEKLKKKWLDTGTGYHQATMYRKLSMTKLSDTLMITLWHVLSQEEGFGGSNPAHNSSVKKIPKCGKNC